MDIGLYLAGMRAEIKEKAHQKAIMLKHGLRSQSRWGREPWIDTTQYTLNRLDRERVQLQRIHDAIIDGRPIR